MANNTIYKNIFSWFNDYTRSYFDSEPVDSRAATLKHKHTLEVVKNNVLLCDSIGIDNELRHLSEIVALLHDIGRFEQFRRYKTFADRHSVNHAVFGIQIIDQYGILNGLSREHQVLVKNAILHHNVPSLPSDLDEVQTMLCQLIRDADKLDIYRIASEHYKQPDARDREIIGIGISEGNTISNEVVAAICAKKSVDYSQMKSINDFKLVQLGWVFDLNFPMSIYLIARRNHYYDIRDTLPSDEGISAALKVIDQHVEHILSQFTTK
jgi:putative nucleotidyltransferase with HDIG domain